MEGRGLGKVVFIGEPSRLTQSNHKEMSPELVKISHLSETNPETKFSQLMHHFDVDSLRRSYTKLSGSAAVGSDGVSKAQYGEALESNLRDLVNRLKRMGYRPSPVKEVMIPKDGKAQVYRPLGLSDFEDKLVQKRFQEILEAIYEPEFHECSYGFRPKRSCHDAIKALDKHLYKQEKVVVIDLDLKNYFGSIDHEILIKFLRRKITDERFLRYIQRMLKCGILNEGCFRRNDEGVTQGSVCSPILANVFAHYVLDEWLEGTVQSHCASELAVFRYADDVVICCGTEHDAMRIRESLIGRLGKFGLVLNEEKTKLVQLDKHDLTGSGVFDFLGFTFYLGLSQTGRAIPRLKSSGKKLRVKLSNVNVWCKRYRNEYRLSVLWQRRRSQMRSMTFRQFKNYMRLYPPPRAVTVHRLY